MDSLAYIGADFNSPLFLNACMRLLLNVVLVEHVMRHAGFQDHDRAHGLRGVLRQDAEHGQLRGRERHHPGSKTHVSTSSAPCGLENPARAIYNLKVTNQRNSHLKCE